MEIPENKMPIYKPPSVEDQPTPEIHNWSVREIHNGGRHIVGVIPESGHDGRVSSPIQKVEGNILTTRSGRRYKLIGHSGSHPDGEYVWSIWCRANRIDLDKTIDVSNEYEGDNRDPTETG